MKITNLEIKNFRNLSHVTDAPEKINVLLAGNGHGKTTYLRALRYALTGEGKTAEFIKGGSTAAETSVEIDGVTISRGKSATTGYLKLNGKTTTQKSINQMFSTMGVNSDAIKLITSSSLPENLEIDEISKFIMEGGVMKAEVEIDKLIDMCRPLSERAEEEMRNYFPAAPDKISLEDIKAAYGEYVSLRRISKSKYAAAKAKADEVAGLVLPELTLEEVEKRLCELDTADSTKAIEAYNAVLRRRNEILEQIKQIDFKLSENKATRPVESVLNDCNKRIAALREEQSKTQRNITVMDTNIKSTQEILANINTNCCPIHKDIVCTSDKSVVKEKLEKVLSDTVALREKLSAELEGILKSIKLLEDKIAAYHANEKEYNAKIMLISKKNTLNDSLPALPPEPEVKMSPEKAKEVRQSLNEIKRRIIIYNEGVKFIKEAEENKNLVSVYDEIADKLSLNSGVRVEILSMALEPLIEVCNETAKKLKIDFELKADLSGGFSIKVRPNSEPYFYDYAALSNGEKAVVELLIMDMLNKLTNFRILIMDNLDSLDSSTFENLLKLITSKEFSDGYDHIFLSAVDHEDTRNVIAKYSVHQIM